MLGTGTAGLRDHRIGVMVLWGGGNSNHLLPRPYGQAHLRSLDKGTRGCSLNDGNIKWRDVKHRRLLDDG